MGNAKGRADSGIAAKIRNPLRIKVLWDSAESGKEEIRKRRVSGGERFADRLGNS